MTGSKKVKNTKDGKKKEKKDNLLENKVKK